MPEGEGQWVPEFPGQRPPFAPGNDVGRQFEVGHELSLTHGAYSPRKVEPLAREYVELVLADPSVPAYAKSPAYRAELWATARAEAQVQLVTEYLITRGEESGDGVGDLGDDRVRAAYLLLHRAEARAASGRTRLGLTPVSAARMGKDVAIGQAASTDVAVRMAQLHDAEQRLREQGWTPPPGWTPELGERADDSDGGQDGEDEA